MSLAALSSPPKSPTAGGYDALAAFYGKAKPSSTSMPTSSSFYTFPESQSVQSVHQSSQPLSNSAPRPVKKDALVPQPQNRSYDVLSRENHQPKQAPAPKPLHSPQDANAETTLSANRETFPTTPNPKKSVYDTPSANSPSLGLTQPELAMLPPPPPGKPAKSATTQRDAVNSSHHTKAQVSSSKPKRRQYTKSGSVMHDSLPVPPPPPSKIPSIPEAESSKQSYTAGLECRKSQTNLSLHGHTASNASSRTITMQPKSVSPSEVSAVTQTNGSDCTAAARTTLPPLPARQQPEENPLASQSPRAYSASSPSSSPLQECSPSPQKPILRAHYASDGSDWSSVQPLSSPRDSEDGKLSCTSSVTSEGVHQHQSEEKPTSPPRRIDKNRNPAQNDSPTIKSQARSEPADFGIAFKPLIFGMLPYLEWQDLRSLRAVSRTTRHIVDSPDTSRLILNQFLAEYGYDMRAPDEIPFGFPDLDAFLVSREFERCDYAQLSREHWSTPLPKVTIRMLRSTARAHSRLAARLRSQVSYDSATLSYPKARAVFKAGRALFARVWVPIRDTWMSDEELVECERELLRAGVWHVMQRGDVVQNLAAADFGNDGKLIFDGKVSCSYCVADCRLTTRTVP